MKFYINPEAKFVIISSSDIMTTSPLLDGGLFDDNSNKIGWSEILDRLGI